MVTIGGNNHSSQLKEAVNSRGLNLVIGPGSKESGGFKEVVIMAGFNVKGNSNNSVFFFKSLIVKCLELASQ